MRSQTRISKRIVDQLTATDSKRIVWDADLRGFGVVASPGGTKSYIVNYRTTDGSYRRLTLGTHGRLTPDEARQLAKKRLGEIADGADPLAQKRAQRKREGTTFAAVAERFIAEYARKKRAAAEIERIIRVYLLPRLGKLQIGEIRRNEISDLLDEIEAGRLKANGKLLGGPVMADRTLAWLRKVMAWWATKDSDFNSPIVRGMARTHPKELARKRILGCDKISGDVELIAFWQATEELRARGDVFANIAQMLLLTGQRRDEVAHMTWGELKGSEWVIPGSRYKTGEANHVPLSAKAVALIDAQPRRGKLVFSTDGNRPFSGFTRAKARLDKRMREKIAKLAAVEENSCILEAAKERWTLHDLRRTARTLMVRAGVRPDIAERTLGHAIQGISAVYDRYDYALEKREALEGLAALIDDLTSPQASNVISLVARRTA